MKSKALMMLLFLGLSWQVLFAHTTAEQGFTCPIDDKHWTQQVDASGTQFGQRLDFKPLGPTAAPWTLPQCPKCRFVLYDELSNIPIDKLKPYILSKPYRSASKGQPTYLCLALIQTFLGATPQAIGHAYLRTSWQTESKPIECRKHLESALTQFTASIATLKPDSQEWKMTSILCCELERRTQRFEAAQKRCDELLQTEAFKTPELQQFLKRELEFIIKKDSAPHAIVAEQEELLEYDQ